MPIRRRESCTGNEENLDNCPILMGSANLGDTCGNSDNAYIVCQGIHFVN